MGAPKWDDATIAVAFTPESVAAMHQIKDILYNPRALDYDHRRDLAKLLDSVLSCGVELESDDLTN